jgi:hypothetical protein
MEPYWSDWWQPDPAQPRVWTSRVWACRAVARWQVVQSAVGVWWFSWQLAQVRDTPSVGPSVWQVAQPTLA